MPADKVFESIESVKQIDEAVLLSLMAQFKVSLHDAVLQLMEYHLLPPRIAIDSYNGKSKNPDYSQKVSRGFFCMHCEETGGDYNCPNTGSNSPLFNFTDRAWGANLTSCLGEDLHKPEILSTLTKYYVAHEAQLVLFRPGAQFEYDSELDDYIQQ